MNERWKTTVLDAGGRYGLHPTWKPFTGELAYYLFEPDPVESARLAKKYSRRSDEVKVLQNAVAETEGVLTINFFRNRAMSSTAVRNPISALFKGERRREVEIVERLEVPAVAIDSFCEKNGLSVDFLKLDTEGSEYSILQGGKKQLRDSVLGVRCEISFDRIFDGMPLFSTVHDFMLDRDFFLLNIDYDGRGDYQNDFVKTGGRYGILTSSDAVWLKRPRLLFEPPGRFDGDVESRAMKYAAFCMNNNACDVAIDILLKARRELGLSYDVLQDTRLFRFLDIALHRHFYELKWQPGQSLQTHQGIFTSIFGRKMKEMNEFMQSEELNPD